MTFIIGGVRFKLGFSFAAVVTLTMIIADTPTALVSLLSAAAHETGHLVCLFICGGKPVSVELGSFGMRLTRREELNISYLQELVIFLSGAAVNLILAAGFAVASRFSDSRLPDIGCAVNVILGCFNLLPFEALDGGRALHCLLLYRYDERRADKILTVCSYLTVAFLSLVGVYLYAIAKINVSFVAVTVYLAVLLVTVSFNSLKDGSDEKQRNRKNSASCSKAGAIHGRGAEQRCQGQGQP